MNVILAGVQASRYIELSIQSIQISLVHRLYIPHENARFIITILTETPKTCNPSIDPQTKQPT